jgi:hypothetical protein
MNIGDKVKITLPGELENQQGRISGWASLGVTESMGNVAIVTLRNPHYDEDRKETVECIVMPVGHLARLAPRVFGV